MSLHSLFPTAILYSDSVQTRKHFPSSPLIIFFAAVDGKGCPPSDTLKVARHFITLSVTLAHPAIRKTPFTSATNRFPLNFLPRRFFLRSFLLHSIPQLMNLMSKDSLVQSTLSCFHLHIKSLTRYFVSSGLEITTSKEGTRSTAQENMGNPSILRKFCSLLCMD